VWEALAHRGLVEDSHIRQRPEDLADPELVPGDTINARIVQVALLAGARYAESITEPESDPAPEPDDAGRYRIRPVLGVEIALALLYEYLPETFLQQPVSEAAAQLAEQMAIVVCGVYGKASDALADQITAARTPADADADAEVSAWPPLIETILGQATHDEVFAEHIFVVLNKTSAPLRFALLPRKHWLIYQLPTTATTEEIPR